MRRLIATAAFLTGCGDNLTGIAFDQLDASQRAAECERLTRCGLFVDEATCQAFFRPRDLENTRAAIAAGKISYDGVAASRCHEAIAEMGCDLTTRDTRVLPDACDRITVGMLSDGSECSFDEECASGECDVASCSRNTCCVGTCEPTMAPSPDGGACTLDEDCVSETFCGRDHVCHAFGGTGSPCDADSHCDYGLGCTGAGIDPGACRPLPRVGESCPYRRCAEIGALCDSTFVCVPSGPGATCTDDTQCSSFGECDALGHMCITVPTLGMPCTGLCRGASWCDLDAGLCLEPKGNGEPCRTDAECATQFCDEGVVFDFCASPVTCF